MPEQQMLTKTKLKERGWTNKLISLFLKHPDEVKPNPCYKSAHAMQLYNKTRVESIENSEEFFNVKQRFFKYKEAAIKGVVVKRKNMEDAVNAVRLNLPNCSIDQLRELAVVQYNKRQLELEANGEREYFSPSDMNANLQFLDRICVNYLRHCATPYEQVLRNITGKVGVAMGYKEIRRRIFEEICDKFPELKEECYRQLKLK